MLNITSNSNGFTVEAINNTYYPDNGTLTFGPNQVIMILDDVSEMVTFKDNANRRTLFSGILGQISIDGVVVTRDNIIEKFAEVATSQGGGGDMSNYYTKAQSDAKYATKTEVGDYFDNVAYDSQEKKINFYHDNTVVAYVDATDFIKDGMVSNVTITNGNLVITFNVDAGKQDIVIPLSSIFNPANYYTKSEIDGMIPVVPTNVSAFTNDAGYLTQHQSLDNYYTKTEVDADLAAKQDTLTAGANITIENNVISAQGGGTAQVQSDWNQSDSEAVDFIKNKPTIPVVPTDVSAFNNDAGYLTQHQSLAGYATETWVGQQGFAESASLATVATTGDYDDLTNKPTIPTVPTNVSAFTNDAGYTTNTGTITGITMNGASKGTSGVVDLGTVITEHQSLSGYATETWVGQQGFAESASLATVATTGDYDDLTNKPTIPVVPTDVSAFNNDAGYLTQHQSLANYYTKTEVDGLIPSVADYFDGAEYDSNSKRINFKHGQTVKAYIDATAFIKDGMVSNVEISSGNLVITFNADAGKETITIPLTDIFNPANYYDKTATDNLLAAKADTSSLATVATSGDYDDLTNKPTIPTVPSNVSAFTNDAGYTTNTGTITGITMNGASKGTSGVVDLGTVITEHQSLSGYATETWVGQQGFAESADLATVATSGDYDDLTNKPTIPTVPTDVSAFNNDAGYLTQHQSLAGYATETWVGQQGYLTTQAQADWNESDSSAPDFIKNKPTIPAAQIQSDWNQSSNASADFIKNKPFIPTITYDAQNTALVITTVPPQS